MEKLTRNDARIIESIIYVFTSKFMTSITAYRNDSFTIGQLAANLIQQFSGYLYEGPVEARVERFVQTYLKTYKEVALYRILQNSFDGRLTDLLGSMLMGIPGELKQNGSVGPDAGKVRGVFIEHLKEAVALAAEDLRSDSQKWRHALGWVLDHPVYEWGEGCLYTDDEMNKLQAYYTPLLERHMVFLTTSRQSWGFNYGDGGYLITITMDNLGGRKGPTRVPLELFIQLAGWKRPEEVLRE